MKVCLFTILDDEFFIGFKVFMKSFLAHNDWFVNYDFIILDVGLSEIAKQRCLEIYKNIVFKKPRYEMYKDVNMSQTHEKLKKTYYFLDAFCQYGYDRVVSIDTDMLVLGSLYDIIFNSDDTISGCRIYNKTKDRLADGINAGLFIVGKRYLQENIYHDLVELSKQGFSMPEQKTMNIFFKGQLKYIDKRYNVEKRMKGSKKLGYILDDIKIIHYVGLKPWQDHTHVPNNERGYESWEEKWMEWYRK